MADRPPRPGPGWIWWDAAGQWTYGGGAHGSPGAAETARGRCYDWDEAKALGLIPRDAVHLAEKR